MNTTGQSIRAVAFYFSQTGQALEALKSICRPLENNGTVIYKQIVPKQHYPFPWSRQEFFDVFPETRLGMPPSGIEVIDFSDVQDADMVIIAGQSWYLSPSLPLQSFLRDEQVRAYLRGRQVVFVNACRNMWLMTSRQIRRDLHDIGARLTGHIVLQDSAPNLISVLTVVQWMMHGKKKASALLPESGVSASALQEASRFGDIILTTWREGKPELMQQRLLEAGAIDYKPSILFLEKNGHRMFGLWAPFIRRKGGFQAPQRRRRLSIFYYYLLLVLFLISPFGQLFFYPTWPLQNVGQHKREDCNV